MYKRKIEENTTDNEEKGVEEFNLWGLYHGSNDNEDRYGTRDDGENDRALQVKTKVFPNVLFNSCMS